MKNTNNINGHANGQDNGDMYSEAEINPETCRRLISACIDCGSQHLAPEYPVYDRLQDNRLILDDQRAMFQACKRVYRDGRNPDVTNVYEDLRSHGNLTIAYGDVMDFKRGDLLPSPREWEHMIHKLDEAYAYRLLRHVLISTDDKIRRRMNVTDIATGIMQTVQAISTDRNASGEEEPEMSIQWPEPMAEEAFYGVAGDVVRAIEPHSESDRAGLLVQTLV